MMNIELTFHVKENSPSSQSLLNDVGQYESFNRKRPATNSSDSRQAPAQRVNEHPDCIRHVTKLQCCDIGLL